MRPDTLEDIAQEIQRGPVNRKERRKLGARLRRCNRSREPSEAAPPSDRLMLVALVTGLLISAAFFAALHLESAQ